MNENDCEIWRVGGFIMYAALLWGVWFVVASEVLPWYSECVAAFDLLNDYVIGFRMGIGKGMGMLLFTHLL